MSKEILIFSKALIIYAGSRQLSLVVSCHEIFCVDSEMDNVSVYCVCLTASCVLSGQHCAAWRAV